MDKKTVSGLIEKITSAIADIKPQFQEVCPISIINFEKWDWTQGVGLFTLWQYYKLSGNTATKTRIEKWFDDRFAEGLPEKNINTMCPMLTLACLYEETCNEKYLPYLHEWANYALNGLTRTTEGGLQHDGTKCINVEELWDDTMYMTVMFMAKYGKVFQKAEYVEESEYQYLLHIKYLVDRKTGLWYHGWSFARGDHYAGGLWGRGNSWITAAIPDYLEIAKPQGSVKRLILETYKRQVDALRKTQDEEGMWHTLIDDTTSYQESSATANFAYGILKGIRLGYLDESYLPCANKAIAALIDCIDENGVVGKCSYGTNVGKTLQEYKDIPICPMPYGQTLTALALMEYLKSKP